MLPSPKSSTSDVEIIEPRKKTSENSWADENPYIKRPMNAYMLWCRHHKPEVIRSRPDLKPIEINKLLAAEWKLLTTEEKQPFTDEALKLKNQWYSICKQLRKSKLGNKSTESGDVPDSLSPTSDTETLMSNKVSTSDKGKKRNDPKGSILFRILSSPRKTTPSHIKNPRCAGIQSFTSMPAFNTQSKAAEPYDYILSYPGENTSRIELNPGNSVHSFTRSLSWPQRTSTEPQRCEEEYPLDLSVKKNW